MKTQIKLCFGFVLVLFFMLIVFGCNSSGSSETNGNAENSPDITPPSVSTAAPVDGSAGVATNTDVSVTFDEPCDAATITTSSFTLSGGGGQVAGSVNAAGDTATFDPDLDLSATTTYTATLTTAIADTAGNHLAAEYSWSFTTADVDTSPPTVSSTTPADGQTTVTANTDITVTFSEPCDAATITTGSFTLTVGGAQVAGNVSVAGDTATFDPDSDLSAATTYTATLTTAITDAVGNHLPAEYSWSFTTADAGARKRLPIGMNLTGLVYWTEAVAFTDAMTTASEMITFYDGGDWNSHMLSEIPRDENGWPDYIPYPTSDGHSTKVRFLINNFYSGRYRVLFDGTGSLGGLVTYTNGNYYLDLNGSGSNVWIDIDASDRDDPIRNMRIVPEQYADGQSYPTFNSQYLEGLRPFHTLRFMDWFNTNGSGMMHWADRVTPSYYTQGGQGGIAYEYAIELANELDVDAWVCVPHMASDDFIRNMARLFRDNLEPGRKIYLEYSNEVWNWMFDQAHWVDHNGENPDGSNPAVDAYVRSDLAALTRGFPEKDAYMMARTFRLWSQEFGDQTSQRLVRVATGQQSWPGNTGVILDYLFNTDGIGCDAFSATGYFNFEQQHHDEWVTRGGNVTPLEVINAVMDIYPTTYAAWTRQSAAYANTYNIDYLVYEGGQHMQPWNQGEWDYNQAVYDAQIHPEMYNLYNMNFDTHTEPEVDCKLFMAFSYVGERESRWGSWGHLESLSQIGSNYMVTAPKYQALLDSNTPRDTNPSPAVSDLRTYIFGHSLINHEAGEATFQTNVPYWMALLTQSAGHTFRVEGQYGFLLQHVDLPPVSQWHFEGIPHIWDSDSGVSFADADFDSILLTVANFIQYKPADEPYDGDNPNNLSPVTATLQIADWVTDQEPGIKIYIYENWPDMASMINSFPPTAGELAAYHAYTQNGFHDWWVNYRNLTDAARPDTTVEMIPVGPIISWLLTNTDLSQIPLDDLYEDDAPHGRPTIYFLASLITYMQMQGVPAPDNFEVPAPVHSLVRDNYAQVVDNIWNRLLSHGVVSSD